MKPHTMIERAKFYADGVPGKKWPASIPTVGADGRLQGIWLLGNDYRSKTGYWGSYPPAYLTRVTALFPDAERVLHLFSGSLPKSDDYTRFDLREDVDCDVRGDAHQLASHFPGQTFDIIYADPPYTNEDQQKYNPGLKAPHRKKVLHECAKVLERGGLLVWLDLVFPMFTKREFNIVGVVGIVRSTNHRFRCVTIFRRL